MSIDFGCVHSVEWFHSGNLSPLVSYPFHLCWFICGKINPRRFFISNWFSFSISSPKIMKKKFFCFPRFLFNIKFTNFALSMLTMMLAGECLKPTPEIVYVTSMGAAHKDAAARFKDPISFLRFSPSNRHGSDLFCYPQLPLIPSSSHTPTPRLLFIDEPDGDSGKAMKSSRSYRWRKRSPEMGREKQIEYEQKVCSGALGKAHFPSHFHSHGDSFSYQRKLFSHTSVTSS